MAVVQFRKAPVFSLVLTRPHAPWPASPTPLPSSPALGLPRCDRVLRLTCVVELPSHGCSGLAGMTKAADRSAASATVTDKVLEGEHQSTGDLSLSHPGGP